MRGHNNDWWISNYTLGYRGWTITWYILFIPSHNLINTVLLWRLLNTNENHILFVLWEQKKNKKESTKKRKSRFGKIHNRTEKDETHTHHWNGKIVDERKKNKIKAEHKNVHSNAAARRCFRARALKTEKKTKGKTAVLFYLLKYTNRMRLQNVSL